MDESPKNGPERGASLGVALVTGAAGGIGVAICRVLAAHGMRVAALDRDESALHQAARQLRAEQREVTPYVADVSSPRDVEHVVDEIERGGGPISVAVSAAGILRPGPALDLSDEDWQASIHTNLSGAFFLFRSVGKRMQARRQGNLVAIGSNAATVARTNLAAYAASKAGLLALTRCFGLELAHAGIRCNVVSPGSTNTEMQRAYWTEAQGEREILAGNPQAYRLGIPLQRLAAPEDVAAAVEFLVSDRARHITLHDLRVDGGATLDA